MKTIPSNSAAFSGATKLETPAPMGENQETSAALLAAAIGNPPPAVRTDWTVIAEEDSSFFVPERCTALDDF